MLLCRTRGLRNALKLEGFADLGGVRGLAAVQKELACLLELSPIELKQEHSEINEPMANQVLFAPRL